MRYGYATGFSTPIKDRIDDALIHHIKQAGYDFVEFPLMLLALQPLAECRRVAQLLSSLNLGADSCCNMFPAHLRITGPARDWDAATSYMAGAFERMAGLGVKKSGFRQLRCP